MSSTASPMTQNEYRLKTFHSFLNLLAHLLIGFVVSGALTFAFSNGLLVGATRTHITLCVLGYHLLMAEAILSLSPHNGWSKHLRLLDRKLTHGIMLILGSALAITGSFIKILDKDAHWDTFHGRFALVALVFTTVALVSGSPLWAMEFKRNLPIPVKFTKLVHYCLGTIGFTASTITLCHGFDKDIFREYAGDSIAYTLIGFATCYTVIIIMNPIISFVQKIKRT